MEAAVETGIKIWATGMENLYVDQETNPKPGYNVSLVPTLNCQEKVQMHWQDGRLLYKYVAFVFYAMCGNLWNRGMFEVFWPNDINVTNVGRLGPSTAPNEGNVFLCH